MEDKHLLIILILLTIGTIGATSLTDNKTEKIDNINNITNNLTKFGNDVVKDINNSISNIPSESTSYPKPTYIPTLRSYEIEKNSDIWHAKDSSSYIEPNNEWVKYYAYKLKNNEGVSLYYKTDDGLYPNMPNGDMWQNADYTLYTQQGDCEDLAIVWVSIFRSLGIKAVVVGGYLEDKYGKWIPDFWVEYIGNDGSKHTKIVSEGARTEEYELVPKYIFNDKIMWGEYNENWYR